MTNAICLPFVMGAAEGDHRMQLPYSAEAGATSMQTAGREGARSRRGV